jgi:hypothetical protein
VVKNAAGNTALVLWPFNDGIQREKIDGNSLRLQPWDVLQLNSLVGNTLATSALWQRECQFYLPSASPLNFARWAGRPDRHDQVMTLPTASTGSPRIS